MKSDHTRVIMDNQNRNPSENEQLRDSVPVPEIPVAESILPHSVANDPNASYVPSPPLAPAMPARRGKPLILIAVVIVLFFFIAAAGVFAGIAYGALPFGSEQFRNDVSERVQGLPFMPKTPKYIALQVQKAVTSMKQFNMDTSLTVGNLKPITGSYAGLQIDKFDLHLKGKLDIRDEENPQMDLRVTSGKEFDTELRVLEYVLYFKLNKLPSVLKMYADQYGFPDRIQKKFFNQWLYSESTPPTADAKKDRREWKKQQAVENAEYTKLSQKKLDEALRSGRIKADGTNIKIMSERYNGFNVYKMMMFINKDDLEDIVTLSQEVNKEMYKKKYKREYPEYPTEARMKDDFPIDKLDVVAWIDKSSYYIRKISVKFDVTTDIPDVGEKISEVFFGFPTESRIANVAFQAEKPKAKKHNIPVTFDMALEDINKHVGIAKPKDAREVQAYIQSVMEQEKKDNPTGSIAKRYIQANNMQRRSDINAILNGINQYTAANKGEMPTVITQSTQQISSSGTDLCNLLVPSYLYALPVDPNINTGRAIEKCGGSYMTGYRVSATGSVVTVSAPYAEGGEVISVTR